MTSLLAFVVVVGILVFLHELGHFAVAKAAGVKVERFSVGFPPAILRYRRGETEYVIGMVPLGGYVKMAGEDPLTASGSPRELESKPPLTRLAIYAAGPLMNLIFAVAFAALVFALGAEVPAYLEQPAQVGYIHADSPAATAGLEMGDRIVAFDDRPVRTWEDLYELLGTSPAEGVHRLRIERRDEATGQIETRLVELDFSGSYDPAKAPNGGIEPPRPPRIGALTPRFPAEKAGLRPGDLVVAVAGEPVESWYDMAKRISSFEGDVLTIEVEREGARRTFQLRPTERDGSKFIGVEVQLETIRRRYGPVESLRRGAATVWGWTRLTGRELGKILRGEAGMDSLGGPIMIGQVAGRAAERGATALLRLMAFISLQLGLLNLLPIPILDGGHILFLTIEAVMRRRLSPRMRELATYAGLAALLTLMVVVFFNDIRRLLESVV